MTIIASASAMGATMLSSMLGAGMVAGVGTGALGLSAGAIATAGSVLGGGLAAGAIGAGLGAGTAALTGGDVGKGALMGGVGGALTGGLASGISTAGSAALAGTGAQTAIGAGAGAAGGAAGAAAGGEDPLKGAAFGGITGGIGGYMKGVDAAAAEGGAQLSTIGKTPLQIQAANASSPLIEGANIPASANSAISQIPTATSAGSSILPEFITNNPKTALAAAGLGGAYLMSQQDQGLMANQIPTPSIYDPIPYSQKEIPRTKVPKYYQYADGGIVPPQQQQPAQFQQPEQPMNKFVQMGMQSAQQQLQLAQQIQQAQATQQPQAQQPAGIPLPQQPQMQPQMQPQQNFADGGLTESMGAGAGNTLFGDGKHEAFLQQVQQNTQQLATQQMQGYQTAQPVAPVQPVQPVQKAATGGIMQDNLGGYSHGGIAGLTRGPGDGVNDQIPAQIGDSGKQPARLADGEFVLPSRIVSELGNGSTEAGAKALQAMVDRIQAGRKKSMGKGKVAVDSKARKELLG